MLGIQEKAGLALEMKQRKMTNQFEKDLAFEKEHQLTLIPLYTKLFDRFTFIRGSSPFAIQLQKMGIDTIAEVQGKLITIDEKVRREKWNDILVETMSCTIKGREKKGWLYHDTTFINYIMQNDCYIINLKKLRDWFEQYKHIFEKKSTNQINKTEFYIVPLDILKQQVGYAKYNKAIDTNQIIL